MERRIKQHRRRNVRAVEVTVSAMSIFLILILDRSGLAGPTLFNKLVTTSTDTSASISILPDGWSDKSQDSMRITAPREPNEPLFADAEPAVEPMSEADQIGELNRSRDDLAQKARTCQLRLMELDQGDSPQRQQIAGQMRSIHQQMCGVERNLLDIHQRRRQGLNDQVDREMERARLCGTQIEKLRAEMEDVQRRIDALSQQDREQAKELASAIEQTQREIRVMEQRLSRYGISYAPRMEPNIPNLRSPQGIARVLIPPPPPLPLPIPQPHPLPEGAEPPVPEMVPTPESAAAVPDDATRSMQEQLRRLRAELDAAKQREQTAESRPPSSRSASAYDRGAERRRQRLDAVRDQLQGSPAPPNYRDNPYSVGNADRGWQPNAAW